MSRDFRKARRWQQDHRIGDGAGLGPLLACGHHATTEPSLAAPERKWWCCGSYQKAKR